MCRFTMRNCIHVALQSHPVIRAYRHPCNTTFMHHYTDTTLHSCIIAFAYRFIRIITTAHHPFMHSCIYEYTIVYTLFHTLILYDCFLLLFRWFSVYCCPPWLPDMNGLISFNFIEIIQSEISTDCLICMLYHWFCWCSFHHCKRTCDPSTSVDQVKSLPANLSDWGARDTLGEGQRDLKNIKIWFGRTHQ